MYIYEAYTSTSFHITKDWVGRGDTLSCSNVITSVYPLAMDNLLNLKLRRVKLYVPVLTTRT